MLVGMMSVAFAAEGAPTDTSISVTGLEVGDTVNFYQVLKYDETATSTGGWVATEKFAYNETTNTNGLTETDIQKIVGKGTYATGGANAAQAGIDSALAGRISLLAQAAGVTAKFPNVAADATTKIAEQATTTVGDAGLYLAYLNRSCQVRIGTKIFRGIAKTKPRVYPVRCFG